MLKTAALRDTRYAWPRSARPVLAFLAGGGAQASRHSDGGRDRLAGADVGRAGDCEGCTDAPCNDYNGNGLCCADLTGDGVVDQDDLGMFLDAFMGDCAGECGCLADLNHDGVLDDCDICIMDHEYQSCTGYPPLLLEVWNTLCYDNCSDPDCENDPEDPDSCCPRHCTPCLANKGCLPLAPPCMTFQDLDGDNRPDALVWARDPANSDDAQRRVFWNDFSAGNEQWTEGCLLDDITIFDTSGGRGFATGDLNQDGYPDVVTEPATQAIVRILVNLGLALRCDGAGCGAAAGQCQGTDGANFQQAQGCYGLSIADTTPVETFAIADFDGNGHPDVFLPYEAATYFVKNLGPNDPNCDPNGTEDPPVYEMVQVSTASIGLAPTGLVHPEGTGVNDLDHDGDLDVVFNHRIYQNNTTAANDPNFARLDPNESGLDDLGSGSGTNSKDEGLTMPDLDMDGDEDMVRTQYNGAGWVNANRGDGTFGAKVRVDPNMSSRGWGAVTGDLDNDGDLEVTFGGNFVRNTLVETVSLGHSSSFGQCLYRTTCIFNNGDCSTFEHMLPSVADVDQDGDLDVGQAFNSNAPYRLVRNRLYGPECDEPLRRYVNIRPVRPLDPNVEGPNGRDFTENEFGARVEIVLRNNPVENTVRLRRVQSTTSAGGYLNQNEYLLHFGLPHDPDPNDPNEDLHFDVYVDFPTRSNDGPWRVDWTVNSQLADINLVDLYPDPNDPNTLGRIITVYRDGRVRFRNGDAIDPNDPNAVRLYTLGGPLKLPSAGGGALVGLTGGDKITGVRFRRDPNAPAARVREIVIDGQLDQITEGCGHNLVLVDVTDPNNPVLRGGLKGYTFPDNRRTFIPVPLDPNDPNAFTLPPNDPNTTSYYEIRARVTSYRFNTMTDTTGLGTPLGITVTNMVRLTSSSGKNICTAVMPVDTGIVSSPVTVRLSRREN